MVKTNYDKAYKEVLVILNELIEEDYKKIPKEYIEFFTANCNNNYEFCYDYSKTFEEQELLDDTKYILFGLFEKFGATELQKEKIKAFKNSYYIKIEEEKKEKYNPDDIFQNKKSKIIILEDTNLPIEIKKEKLFNKIIRFIKHIFKKNNY